MRPWSGGGRSATASMSPSPRSTRSWPDPTPLPHCRRNSNAARTAVHACRSSGGGSPPKPPYSASGMEFLVDARLVLRVVFLRVARLERGIELGMRRGMSDFLVVCVQALLVVVVTGGMRAAGVVRRFVVKRRVGLGAVLDV